MYEKRFKSSRFRKSNGVRPSWFGTWFILVIVGFIALQSCCLLRDAVVRYSTDCDCLPYYDTRIVVDLYPGR